MGRNWNKQCEWYFRSVSCMNLHLDHLPLHIPKILFFNLVPHLQCHGHVLRRMTTIYQSKYHRMIYPLDEPSRSFTRLSKMLDNLINSSETKKDCHKSPASYSYLCNLSHPPYQPLDYSSIPQSSWSLSSSPYPTYPSSPRSISCLSSHFFSFILTIWSFPKDHIYCIKANAFSSVCIATDRFGDMSDILMLHYFGMRKGGKLAVL